MKSLRLFVLCFSVFIFSDENQFLVDTDYSPFTGGSVIPSLHQGIQRAEDALIEGPNDLKKQASRRWGRFIELVAFWEPFNALGSVTQHEVFGHGYRIRSLGKSVAEVNGYKINPPFPYGGSGGATYFGIDTETSVSNLLAIDIAGIEAENVMADLLRLRFLQSQSIDGRISSLYTQSEQALFWYSVVTSLSNIGVDTIDEPSGNDIESYIYWMNKTYPDNQLSVGDIQWRSLFNLLDPFTWYGYYAWFKYILYGTPAKPPMIPIGKYRYLPGIKTALTPFGIEYYLMNSLSWEDKGAIFYLRGGKHATTYGGVGARIPHLFSSGRFSLGCSFDVWYQPLFENAPSIDFIYTDGYAHNNPFLNERHIGGAVSLISTFAFDAQGISSLYLEGGIKSKGYLQGYDLRGAPILRGGLMFTY